MFVNFKFFLLGCFNSLFVAFPLTPRLHGLVTARQNDRATISNLERRLQEERQARQAAEKQVTVLERRQKKAEEQAQAKAQALANAK